MNRRFLSIGFLTVVLSLLLGCEKDSSVEPSGKVIKIGIIAPFSGSDFAKGQEGLRGVQTALKMQPLLDNGDRVTIVTKDDQDNAAIAVKALQDLVETEKVSAVFTLSSSGPVLALSEVANTYQTPILAGLATHPDVPQKSRFVSQVCFDNNFQGKVAALFVRDELLVDRVAIFQNPDSYYSTNLATEFKRRFELLEGEVTDLIEINNDGTPLPELLASVKEKDPGLLYLPVSAKDVIAIIQELYQMGWKPKMMASDGLLATVFSQYKEKIGLLNGLMATDLFHHDSRGTFFADRVGKFHEGVGTSYTAMGVEGFSILLDAMNRCHDPADKICVNRQIRSTNDFEGLLGKISIDAEGKARRPMVINTIKKGKLKYVAKVY